MTSVSSTSGTDATLESKGGAEQRELAERVRRGLPVELTAAEQSRAKELAEALRNGMFSVGCKPGEGLLPPTLWQILVRATEVLAQGDAVSVVSTDKLLSTQEAADMLDVSRQYLVRLLDTGKIAQTRTGTHRRVALVDVLKFKERRDSERKAGLRELTQMSIDAGGYKELKRFR